MISVTSANVTRQTGVDATDGMARDATGSYSAAGRYRRHGAGRYRQLQRGGALPTARRGGATGSYGAG